MTYVRTYAARRAVERNGMGSPARWLRTRRPPHRIHTSQPSLLCSGRARALHRVGFLSLLLAFWAAHHRSLHWLVATAGPHDRMRTRGRGSKPTKPSQAGRSGDHRSHRSSARPRRRDRKEPAGVQVSVQAKFRPISLWTRSARRRRRRRPASYFSWRVVRAPYNIRSSVCLRRTAAVGHECTPSCHAAT